MDSRFLWGMVETLTLEVVSRPVLRLRNRPAGLQPVGGLLRPQGGQPLPGPAPARTAEAADLLLERSRRPPPQVLRAERRRKEGPRVRQSRMESLLPRRRRDSRRAAGRAGWVNGSKHEIRNKFEAPSTKYQLSNTKFQTRPRDRQLPDSFLRRCVLSCVFA